MHISLKRQLLVAWIALLGVLFGVLAPAVSHAMASAAPATEEVEVCTMKGMVTIVVDKAQPAESSSPMLDHMFKHCPYCASHGGFAALLPGPSLAFPLSRQTLAYPPLFYQSAASLFAWTVANPRAPPSLA